MASSYKLSSESNLSCQYVEHISPFWHQHVQQGCFNTDDGTPIAFAYCICPNAKSTIVLSPGRTEAYLKYQELAYDLYHNGYSIFIIDHRGQGLSGRLIDNPHKGYVDDFQHYIDDLHYFYHHIVKQKANAPICLLGHSMGATIATLYLQQYPDDFVAAAMSAPLYGFNSGKLPLFIAKPLTQIALTVQMLRGRTSEYFWGQHDYFGTPFEHNMLTHCKPRYHQFRHQYELQSALRLGGITFHWMATTLRALKHLFANIDHIKTPMLMIQSCDDEVVSLSAQARFYKKLQKVGECQKVELHGAKHEVFFETDAMRCRAISSTLTFFDDKVAQRI
jgi:lysophospholipase